MANSVGVIGMGRLGSIFVENLLERGYQVKIYNRTREKMEPLIAKGAEGAISIREVGESCPIVISIVANDAAVEEITVGESGLAASLSPNGIHLSMSTISPDTAAGMESIHQSYGTRYLSALVVGRPDAARARALTILVSGDAAAKEQCRPLLEALGAKQIVDFGEAVTAAAVAKLCTNFLITAAMEAMAEAFALAKKNGLDPSALLDMLTGTLFAGTIYKNYGTTIIAQKFQPAGFLLPLGLKDINLALEVAQESMVRMPIAKLVHDRLEEGMAKGRENFDWAALTMGVWEESGIKT